MWGKLEWRKKEKEKNMRIERIKNRVPFFKCILIGQDSFLEIDSHTHLFKYSVDKYINLDSLIPIQDFKF